jgi:hypothetical protein
MEPFGFNQGHSGDQSSSKAPRPLERKTKRKHHLMRAVSDDRHLQARAKEAAMHIDDHRGIRPPACRLCDGRMKVDIYFAPCGSTSGMVVFTCPRCGNIASEFIEPKSPEQRGLLS